MRHQQCDLNQTAARLLTYGHTNTHGRAHDAHARADKRATLAHTAHTQAHAHTDKRTLYEYKRLHVSNVHMSTHKKGTRMHTQTNTNTHPQTHKYTHTHKHTQTRINKRPRTYTNARALTNTLTRAQCKNITEDTHYKTYLSFCFQDVFISRFTVAVTSRLRMDFPQPRCETFITVDKADGPAIHFLLDLLVTE